MANAAPLLPHFVDNLAPAPWAGAPLRKIQADALIKLKTLGIPNNKDESWRQTSMKPLLRNTFNPQAEAANIPASAIAALRLPQEAVSASFVFINGQFAPQLSTPSKQLPAGCRVLALAEAFQRFPQRYLKFFNVSECPFTLLNTAACDSGVVVDLDPKVQISAPIELFHIVTNTAFTAPRHIIWLGEDAQAHVVEHSISPKTSTGWENRLTQIHLDTRSTLHHSTLLQGFGASHHTNHTKVHSTAHAAYHRHSFTAGTALCRQSLHTLFAGDHSQAHQNSTCLINGTTVCDTTTRFDHKACGCSANVNTHQCVDGAGKSVFQGMFYVAPGAQKTADDMTCHNLLLSDDAEAFSKPELEIHADDVLCGHGSTTSSLDGDQLFYLQSRGIDAQTAQAMLLEAFVTEPFAQSPLVDFFTQTAQNWLK